MGQSFAQSSATTSAASALQTRKDVHVLFVHGVGRHSRWSSLLKAYQSLHAYLRSPEAPVQKEDLFEEWRLAEFNDSADPEYLRLAPVEPDSDTHKGVGYVYLYEVNYSALAGVVRENHPLDLTHLFISLDLAVNVARTRLESEIAECEVASAIAELEQHLEIARVAQKITGVLTAATVPILGLPSLLLRRHIAPFVADFTRFFEDVATFALDRNGESLISSHFDHTIASLITAAEEVKQAHAGRAYEFVIVAHSLGTVVTHSFLVRHWTNLQWLPARIVTLGSPIALVCWLWRFLDFKSLRFGAETRRDDPYFCWTPNDPPATVASPIEWVNVVTHLDPIATAFPKSDLYLSMKEAAISARLADGDIAHHFIDTGGFRSIGAAHTRYFDDKKNFIKILGKAIRLRGEWLDPPQSREAKEHWAQTARHLFGWQVLCFGFGLAFLVGYFHWLSHLCGMETPWLLMMFYVAPPWVIAYLGFWQRLLFGVPTKRTTVQTIKSLSAVDRFSIAYLLRQWLMRTSDPRPEAPRPDFLTKYRNHLISFFPTLLVMILPIVVMKDLTGVVDIMRNEWKLIPFLVALFMGYTLFFGASELVRHWRKTLQVVGLLGVSSDVQIWESPYRWICHKCSKVNKAGSYSCIRCQFPTVATGTKIAVARQNWRVANS